MKGLALPLALAIAATPVTAATPQTAPLPADIDDGWVSGFMSRFREPPFWTPDALKGFRTRTRVSLMSNYDVMVSLRIDERADGKLIGTAVEVGRARRGYRDVIRYHVSRKAMASLEKGFSEVDLFKFARGSFEREGEVCIDGLVMVFERVNADGYRHLETNALCDAPQRLRAVTREWLALVEVEQFAAFLK